MSNIVENWTKFNSSLLSAAIDLHHTEYFRKYASPEVISRKVGMPYLFHAVGKNRKHSLEVGGRDVDFVRTLLINGADPNQRFQLSEDSSSSAWVDLLACRKLLGDFKDLENLVFLMIEHGAERFISRDSLLLRRDCEWARNPDRQFCPVEHMPRLNGGLTYEYRQSSVVC